MNEGDCRAALATPSLKKNWFHFLIFGFMARYKITTTKYVFLKRDIIYLVVGGGY